MPDYLHRRTRGGNLAPWQPCQVSTFPPANIVENKPAPASLPERVPAPKRAAQSAYWIDPPQQTFLVNEDPAPGRPLFPERAPAAPRTVLSAYQITQKGQDEDLPGDRPRGYQDQDPRPIKRAAPSAYQFRNELVPPETIPEPSLGIRGTVAEPQRFPPRAGLAAYQIQLGIPPGENPVPGQQLNPRPHQFQVRRAAEYAYWLPVNRQIDEAAPPSPATLLLPVRAPGPPRQVPAAYDAGGGVVEWMSESPPAPGCPVRHRHPDEAAGRRARNPETASAGLARIDQSADRRARRDECK